MVTLEAIDFYVPPPDDAPAATPPYSPNCWVRREYRMNGHPITREEYQFVRLLLGSFGSWGDSIEQRSEFC